jgi:hypothetical protein
MAEGQLGSLVVSLQADIARFTADMGKAGRISTEAANNMAKSFDNAGASIKTSMEAIAKSAAVAFATIKMVDVIKDSTMLAARVETLGTVMKVVGNNAGYTASQMAAYQKSVAAMGITTQESMNSLVKMAGSQMDLSKSTELARVAQDAAVIGGINSSEAFGRMIQGIRSGEPEILKNIGINVQFEEGYKKTAATLGTTADKLTSAQKMTSRMNEVLSYGVNISGAYEASMSTAGKQMASMARYTEELKLKFGEAFRPVFVEFVKELTSSLKGLDAGLQNNAGSVKVFADGLVSSFQLAKREMLMVSGLLDKIGGTTSGVMAAMFGPGMMAGNKNSAAQFDKWMAINADYKKRYEQNRFDLTEADSAMRNGTANEPGEQAWITGRAIALENQKIAAGAAARAAAEKATAKKAKPEKYSRDNDLLLKNIKEYAELLRDQEQAFNDLAKEMAVTSQAAVSAFQIGTMQTGDLSTGSRYKVTPLSKYRLRTDDQYSISQSGPDLKKMEDEAKAASMMRIKLDREILSSHQYDESSRLATISDELTTELEMRIDFASKLVRSEDEKWALMLQAEEAYNAKRTAATSMSWNAVGGIVANQLSQMAGMMAKGNKDQFEAYKAMSMVAAGINTAMAISGMLAQTKTLGWAAIPLSVVAGGLGAAQVAMIASQQYEGRALGGPVKAGQTYIVNENRATQGPEYFTPGTSGTITPANKMGSGQAINVTPVFQISTGVTDTARAEMMRIYPTFIQGAVMAVRQAMRNGQMQEA